jgi:hypothetical protein
MNTKRLVTPRRYCAIGAIGLMAFSPLPALGHDQQADPPTAQQHHAAQDQSTQVSGFVKVVRDATERFRDVAAAEAEGYALLFGCVSGPDTGAMGLHFVNLALVGDGELDATRPEIVIYEPMPNGRRRLIGADYLVLADAWHAKNPAPPELGGQLLHLFESPNRFGLPSFYTLHVWAWKENPNGAFVNWHPKVSCHEFTPPSH